MTREIAGNSSNLSFTPFAVSSFQKPHFSTPDNQIVITINQIKNAYISFHLV